jgi:integrase
MAARMEKTRRPRGTGSLTARKDRTGGETWYGRFYVDGRLVKRRIGPKRREGTSDGLTRAQAEKALRRLLEEGRPTVPAEQRIDLAEAAERYLLHLERKGRKASTLEDYRSFLRVHLVPFFGGKSLDTITPTDVEAFIAAERRDGRSAKSILNYLSVLHSIFAYGEHPRRSWCRHNPVKLAEGKPEAEESADIRYLDQEEVEALVAATPDDVLGPTERVIYLTAAMTGLRQGELLALRWQDVDWIAARLRVRQNYVRGEFGTPKSKRSTRSVPLADRVAAELERHFQRSPFQGDDDLVFPHPLTGTPLDSSKLLKRFKQSLKRAGLRELRFHDLRHTFGTAMAGAGVPMRTLQEWMGHRDLKTTQRYADYAPSRHEAEWVQAAFAPRGHNGGHKVTASQSTSGN